MAGIYLFTFAITINLDPTLRDAKFERGLVVFVMSYFRQHSRLRKEIEFCIRHRDALMHHSASVIRPSLVNKVLSKVGGEKKISSCT